MSLKSEMSLELAKFHANTVLSLLSIYCEKSEIAGSIRREKSIVGDIEIVAIPKFEYKARGLHKLLANDNELTPVSLLDEMIDVLRARGDCKIGKNGHKYKELIYDRMDFKVDLFIAKKENYGLIKMIRTGPALYARQFMIELNKLGKFRVSDGYLWKINSSNNSEDLIPVPTEEILYETVGFSWTKPEKRIKDIF